MKTYIKCRELFLNNNGYAKDIVNGVFFSDYSYFLQNTEPTLNSTTLYIVNVIDNATMRSFFYLSTDYNHVKTIFNPQNMTFVLQVDSNLFQQFGYENLVLGLKKMGFLTLSGTSSLDFYFSKFFYRHGIIRSPIIIANFLEELKFEYYGGLKFLESLSYESCLHGFLHNSEITQYFKKKTEAYFTDPIGLFSRKFKMLPEKYLKGVRIQFLKEYIINNSEVFEDILYSFFKNQNVLLYFLGINKLEFRNIIKDVYGVSPKEIYLQLKVNRTKCFSIENNHNIT